MGVELRNRPAASDAVSQWTAGGGMPAAGRTRGFSQITKRLDTQARDVAPDFSAPERPA